MTAKTVKKQRARVAERIEDLYWKGEDILGLEMRELVHETNMGIQDYIKDIENKQQASIMEIRCGLRPRWPLSRSRHP